MKYFSLFSGVGGFELAINNVYENRVRVGNGKTEKGNGESDTSKQSLQATDESTQRQGNTPSTIESRNTGEVLCVGFSEIDKYAISVYQYHYKHKNYGNIQEIDWNTVPDFDLVVGGSPCQDLSVAGKQKGLSGARSGLFFEFIRCLKEKQPTNFIWENVKGALSSSSGWDFARVQIEFSEAGYDVEWQVLNAKDFGVPQNRERIFVVGHLRGKSQPKVFPIRNTNKTDTEPEQKFSEQVSNTLRTNYSSGYSNETYVLGRNESYAIDSNYHKGTNTLDDGRRQMVLDTSRIRRLTPLECERLMSWPDDWTKEPNISDTQRYKMCGNGVVSKVVEAVVERLYPDQEQLSDTKIE